MTMIRGCLVGLIHSKALTIQDGVRTDSSAVSLMSTEVDNVHYMGFWVQIFWSSLLEVVIGYYLLTRELGWTAFIPIILTIGKSSYSFSDMKPPTKCGTVFTPLNRMVSRNMGAVAQQWSEATQVRVGKTSSMLDHIKGVKMQGMAMATEKNLQDSRSNEMVEAKKFRMAILGFNATGKSSWLASRNSTDEESKHFEHVLACSYPRYLRDPGQATRSSAGHKHGIHIDCAFRHGH